jgi:hypothetical protein
MRDAGLLAAVHYPLREFMPHLREMAARDPDEELRDDARVAIDAYRRQGVA